MNIIQKKEFKILPPAPGLCQICAVKHEPDQPHDRQSLFYQFTYAQEHEGKSPTWAQAMEHCSDEVKKRWTELLIQKGQKID